MVNRQKKLNQTVKKVTEDMYNFKYNTAIASIMELMNTLEDNKTRNLSASILKSLALLLAPFAPHLAEEIWVKILGQPFSIHKANWPKYDNSLIGSDTVTIIIQVNGKLRSHLVVSNKQSTKKEDIETLSKKDENVAKWLKNHGIKKVIFVSGKLINFVI